MINCHSIQLNWDVLYLACSYTLYYRIDKPEKYELFCERIFGSIKSEICACENYQVIGDKKTTKIL